MKGLCPTCEQIHRGDEPCKEEDIKKTAIEKWHETVPSPNRLSGKPMKWTVKRPPHNV